MSADSAEIAEPAAAIGAISGTVNVLGRRTLFADGWRSDLFKLALMLITVAQLTTWKKIPEPLIILGAAIIGLNAWFWHAICDRVSRFRWRSIANQDRFYRFQV